MDLISNVEGQQQGNSGRRQQPTNDHDHDHDHDHYHYRQRHHHHFREQQNEGNKHDITKINNPQNNHTTSEMFQEKQINLNHRNNTNNR